MSQNVAFLGAGNMGAAIATALLEQNVLLPENLKICDPNPEKLQNFAQKGCFVSERAEEVLPKTQFVFLAVKPQTAGELLRMLDGSFEQNTVLISIAAGLSVDFLQKVSGLTKMIRVMPNTPALVGRGVSGVYFPPEISEKEKSFVTKLLQSFSTVIVCEDEEKIDQLTTISGCGPAYFFRILEILANEAQCFGFSQEDARNMALETLCGAGELAQKSGESFKVLREKVTSKGGVTEEALRILEENELPQTVHAALTAALQKTKELSR